MVKCLVLIVLAFALQACGFSIVDPGNRGVKVHLGEVSPDVLPEGLVLHLPLVTHVEEVSVRQHTDGFTAECYSNAQQQVTVVVKVLYRVPPNQAVTIFHNYAGDPFKTIVEPKTQEALKEVVSLESAQDVLKNREKIKQEALASARKKIGDLLVIEDVILENVSLSKDLEAAIESKMTAQQDAAKAEFIKQRVQVEAYTAVIKAQGEANAIKLRSDALKENPRVIDLIIAEKWDGKAPLYVGGNQSNMLLPMAK